MNNPDDRHLFEMLVDLEQGTTGAHAYDPMDDVFFNEAVQWNPVIECSRCHEQFHTYPELDLHIPIHGKHLGRCDVCNVVMTKSYIRKHKEYTHNIYIQYKCDRCEESFNSMLDLNEHRLSHDTICLVCNKDLTHMREPQIRKRHIMSHFKQPEYQCTEPGCGRQFKLLGNLEKHKKNIHENPMQIHCPIPGCQYTSYSNGNMQNHVRFTHGPHQNLVCPHCEHSNKTYANERSLKKHMKTLHRIIE